ncbi:S8 family peptidase [Streptomyces cadmiisoli]|uniref:S8 family peptidase n=1 Tax=Streptomyces cadmiisoli TaxID=2184053 RepID=UPI003646086A
MATHAAEPDGKAPITDTARTKNVGVTADGDLKRIVAAAGGSVTVTLITGDKVQVGIDADGKVVARDFTSAVRPDGSPVEFQTLTRNGKVHVVPDDALGLVHEGLLDWGLFDLAQLVSLVAAGRVGEVPVLVTYSGKDTARRAPKAAGASAERHLSSINGRAWEIAGNGRWWQGARGTSADKGAGAAARSAGSLAGVKKVWLDSVVKVDLETSVPQIGAKSAWDRGYDGTGVSVAVLDTGIDPDHPDVSGNLIEQVDFTGAAPGARDGHGHGTHVAATVLGSGAASKGLRKGVAPGAKLRVGKVLDDEGSGYTSDIIAGMEWAGRSGAKVVNMSLGGGPTDGTDVSSQALNQISRSTGTLFVVAAGNRGPFSETVGSPGAADEALTVAAVDREDEMASFSSRGPRFGDGAFKPDIAAPGVGIVAARAAGTAMGTVVDEHYTRASGTSMAAPHVAGAAALIAQQRPNLTGDEIKAVLMSTATDVGHDVFAQGAGRVNSAAALDPMITAKRNLEYGRHVFPHSPLTQKVSYRNHTDAPVTLKLTASMSVGTTPAPDGLVSHAGEVVVPANGAADVPVTIDGRVLGTEGPFGAYRGRLDAHDSSGALRGSTRLGAYLEREKFPLTVNVIRPPGALHLNFGPTTFLPLDENTTQEGPERVDELTAPVSTRLVPGTYSVSAKVDWHDEDGNRHAALPIAAEVSLTKATTITFDLRKLKPLTVQTPESTENYESRHLVKRTSATGKWAIETYVGRSNASGKLWALPTAKVRTGTLTHELHSVRTAPVVTMRAVGGGSPFGLSPRYQTSDVSVGGGTRTWQENGKEVTGEARVLIPRLPVKGHLPVVHAGTGTATEIAKVNARGRLVLMTPTDICGAGQCTFEKLRDERVAAAHAAGAVGVLVAAPGLRDLAYGSAGYFACTDGLKSCPEVKPYAALPIVHLPYSEAERLIKRLEAAPSKVQIILGGSAEPTVYGARYSTDGQIPSNLTYRLREEDVDRVDHSFLADRPQQVTHLTWEQHAKSGASVVPLPLPRTAMQQTLTTYFKQQDDTVHRFDSVWADQVQDSLLVWAGRERQDTVLGSRNELRWNEGPTVPGAVAPVRTRSGFELPTGTPCVGCRQGNTFYPAFALTSGAGAPQTMFGAIAPVNLTDPFVTPSCPPPACGFKLFDEQGDELSYNVEFRHRGDLGVTPEHEPWSRR